MNSVAAVVVTYNKRDLLLENLTALFGQTAQVSIIVVDNDSQDGTGEAVRKFLEKPGFHYFNTHENLGGAGGFHYGITKANELGYDYVWLMDDDAIPEPDALEEILKATEQLDGNFGFLCSNVRFTDGSACEMNIPDLHEKWLNSAELMKQGLLRVDRATFVGFFLSMDTVRKVGLPIKEFFIWADDTNYSHRINKLAPCYFVLDSKITHKMALNQTASLVNDKGVRLERYFYAYRNRHYNARTEGWEGKYLLRILTTTIRILTKSDRKKEKLLVMYRGVLAGFFFRPQVDYLS